MTDRIDAAIADVSAEVEKTQAEPQETEAAQPEDASTSTDDQSQGDSESEQTTNKPADEGMWPKKAVNALARRDRQIGKLKADNTNLMNRLSEIEARLNQGTAPQNNQQKANDAPQEADFDNYADYLMAMARHEVRKEMTGQTEKIQAQQQQQYQQSQEARYYQEREAHVAQLAQQAAQNIPDYIEVLTEYADVMDNLPQPIERLFLEADDGAMAFYNLAKEGKIEALLTMSPSRAAFEIGRAQGAPAAKAQPVKQVTKAPEPMTASKPNTGGGKRLDDMSYKDIKAWLNS